MFGSIVPLIFTKSSAGSQGIQSVSVNILFSSKSFADGLLAGSTVNIILQMLINSSLIYASPSSFIWTSSSWWPDFAFEPQSFKCFQRYPYLSKNTSIVLAPYIWLWRVDFECTDDPSDVTILAFDGSKTCEGDCRLVRGHRYLLNALNRGNFSRAVHSFLCGNGHLWAINLRVSSSESPLKGGLPSVSNSAKTQPTDQMSIFSVYDL